MRYRVRIHGSTGVLVSHHVVATLDELKEELDLTFSTDEIEPGMKAEIEVID